MKVLVLGGTGFISRRLVDLLINDGADITMATSGKTPNPFGSDVDVVKVDRFDRMSLYKNLNSPPFFDVIYDMLGFRSRDVNDLVELFKNRAGRLVYTSSASVYRGLSGTFTEGAFDPTKVKIETPGMESSYEEGKRNCESILFGKAPFPVAAARFPNVIGHDDSTLRFQDHLSRIKKGETFLVPRKSGRRNYVWVDDAGRFLFWLGKQGKTGAYNAASSEYMEVSKVISKLGEFMGVPAKIERTEDGKSNSAYYSENDYILSTKKAESEGFKFTKFEEWLKNEVSEYIEKDGKSFNSADYRASLF
ncbi:MAG: NAD-dependent epimerase/dehydratase family protein [Candidatus Thermoplasmatota archaeon]|nr:NAD-dependent epimerase/dehydratase family protein [Candidatus Thermoplasmatota archaeon]